MNNLKTVALAAAALALMATPTLVGAEGLATPEGAIVLTVNGEIGTMNAADTAQFDLEMLEAMPVTTITTSTPWTDGETVFEGVLLSDLFETLGADGTTLTATALNDYAVTMPVTDEMGAEPLLAYKADGNYLSVRDKGPLWIVYPYDQDPSLTSEVYLSRSIWQLDRLTVSR